MTKDLRREVLTELERLSEDELHALLAALRRSSGRPMRRFSRAVGSLSAADAREMLALIEEQCERVDPDGW